MIDAFERIVERIENRKISMGAGILTFFAIVSMRNFFETFSVKNFDLFGGSPLEWGFFLHHSVLFYGMSFL